ncbi:hypothetical protein R5R35_002860 [Gryllus longicercus]|uniref:C-type lectin domain-containing protein n=1 Tax=Gryllus longicercus TaxID=2509291 RepID=A0AAN9V4P8_9ORTH
MDWRGRNFLSSLLLLLPALIAAVPQDPELLQRTEFCNRMCPDEPPPPPALLPGAALAGCPGLRCPAPVCPAPVCPSPASPPACPLCPRRRAPPLPPPPNALAWKTLKARNYTSTSLGYYKYYSDSNLDWFDAQTLCESEGAHLVILNSEQEDEFIRNAILPGWIHIGIHHLNPRGTYTTVLGQPVNSTGFRHWLPGHFVRNLTSNCGFINKGVRGMGMGRCRDIGPFICEL